MTASLYMCISGTRYIGSHECNFFPLLKEKEKKQNRTVRGMPRIRMFDFFISSVSCTPVLKIILRQKIKLWWRLGRIKSVTSAPCLYLICSCVCISHVLYVHEPPGGCESVETHTVAAVHYYCAFKLL